MTESKESLRDKFKNLLSLSKPTSPKPVPVSAIKDVICDEFWLDISASQPAEMRVDKIREAIKVVESEILDDSVVKRLWLETKDLLQPESARELRVLQLRFVRCMIQVSFGPVFLFMLMKSVVKVRVVMSRVAIYR